MITPETFALPNEVFITNAIIHAGDTIKDFEDRTVARRSGYSSLRFQYENIVAGWDEVYTSEEFGVYCTHTDQAIGVAVYGIPLE